MFKTEEMSAQRARMERTNELNLRVVLSLLPLHQQDGVRTTRFQSVVKHNKDLMDRKSKATSTPPLRDSAGKWTLDAADKATLLAETFVSKCKLPPNYDDVFVPEPADELTNFLMLRPRWAKRALKATDPNNATGPDLLPGRTLRENTTPLAIPVARSARRLLADGMLPKVWKMHWVHPLFKNGAPSCPNTYRGVHHTAVLSKVVERPVARLYLTFFEKSEAYGKNQLAFRSKCCYRDLVTLKVRRWIQAAYLRRKTDIFLSDMRGAFDRVEAELLLRILRRTGIGATLLCKPQVAKAMVHGRSPGNMFIKAQIFFPDVSDVVQDAGFRKDLFADDLTCEITVSADTAAADITAELQECQRIVHQWGSASRVDFGPAKQEMKTIHPAFGDGEVFKYPEARFHCKLLMGEGVSGIVGKCKIKVKAILRCCDF